MDKAKAPFNIEDDKSDDAAVGSDEYHNIDDLSYFPSLPRVQCNQAREQNFISEFEPILTHKTKSIRDKTLKLGANLLQHKLYIKFKLWDVTMITIISWLHKITWLSKIG